MRIFLGWLHVEYPNIPHDFYVYIRGAKTLLLGNPLYGIVFEETGLPYMYGPLTAVIFAVWIWIFGENYILLKFPSIIFDCLTIILIFYTIKELTNNERIAKLGSIFYSFSYMSVLNSGVLGQNDLFFIFFIVFSLYLLIKDRYILAGISLGIGIGFLIIPLLIFPASVYYIYKRFNLISAFKYIALVGIIFFIILTIFYINSGTKAFYPYSGYYHTYPVAMLSTLNFIKTLIGIIIPNNA